MDFGKSQNDNYKYENTINSTVTCIYSTLMIYSKHMHYSDFYLRPSID